MDSKRVIELWLEGLSGGQVAAACGKTRNAVMGIVHRAGIRRKKPVAEKFATKTAKSYPGGLVVRRYVPLPEPAPPLPSAPSGGVNLLDLESRHCRWPLDTRDAAGFAMFCGSPTVDVVGFPYCHEHLRRATTAPTRSSGSIFRFGR